MDNMLLLKIDTARTRNEKINVTPQEALTYLAYSIQYVPLAIVSDKEYDNKLKFLYKKHKIEENVLTIKEFHDLNAYRVIVSLIYLYYYANFNLKLECEEYKKLYDISIDDFLEEQCKYKQNITNKDELKKIVQTILDNIEPLNSIFNIPINVSSTFILFFAPHILDNSEMEKGAYLLSTFQNDFINYTHEFKKIYKHFII